MSAVPLAPPIPRSGESAPAARPGQPGRDPIGRAAGPDLREAVFAIPGLRCGGCVVGVERALSRAPGVAYARANLTAKRITVRWREGEQDSAGVAQLLERAGFPGQPVAPETASRADRDYERQLLLSLGIAGFAAMNVMLLSVAVWWGVVSDMEPETQALFHWTAALIALPAVALAGRPFFASAWSALRGQRLNMDVPISLAVVLATGMSLLQTTRGSDQVYFDAATALLFFLLIGRYLDTVVRRSAQDAAHNLLALRADTATLVLPDGSRMTVASEELRPGDRVAVAPGDRIPVDGTIRAGSTDLDASLISGESLPSPGHSGTRVFAGVLNLTGAIEVETSQAGERTLLAEIGRLMETAEQGRAHYVRLADRVARLYSPAVHVLGLTTFLTCMALGLAWEEALTRAIAVLIVTCPCALALAVPAAQVAATGRLLRRGILIKTADALERLAEVDIVATDKTGTLTRGQPRLITPEPLDPETLGRAAALAAASRHPLSGALLRAAEERLGPIAPAADVREHPGRGLVRPLPEGEQRLGSGLFVAAPDAPDRAGMELWFGEPGRAPVRYAFEDELRPDAVETVRRLRDLGLPVEILSGDREVAVGRAAAAVGVGRWAGELAPQDKIARLDALKREGRRVLMVGDGLNDAPALAAAYASMSPASAADISQVAADAVLQGERLGAVADAIVIARRTRRIVLQNFALAFGYNVVFVPLAMTGFVTPLVAAIAMSTSSIAVTLNAIRLRRA